MTKIERLGVYQRNKIGEALEADCFQDVFTNENGQHDTLLRLKPDSPWRELVLLDRSYDWSRERFEGAPGMSKQEAMAYDVERHQEIIQRGVQEQGLMKMKLNWIWFWPNIINNGSKTRLAC